MILSKQAGHWLPRPRKVSTLTIPKAIEILKLAISDPDLVGAVDLLDAQKLAIDALTFLAECHTDGSLMKTFSPTGKSSQ
ncbi:hypothetical protein ES703_113386 [subsurface metagenome]